MAKRREQSKITWAESGAHRCCATAGAGHRLCRQWRRRRRLRLRLRRLRGWLPEPHSGIAACSAHVLRAVLLAEAARRRVAVGAARRALLVPSVLRRAVRADARKYVLHWLDRAEWLARPVARPSVRRRIFLRRCRRRLRCIPRRLAACREPIKCPARPIAETLHDRPDEGKMAGATVQDA